MANTINQQQWKLQDQANYQILEQQKVETRGQKRLAQVNHNKSQQKDVIVPSQSGAGGALQVKSGSVKPNLPIPMGKFSGLTSDDGSDEGGKTIGLIALIGEVMGLQAKSNSNFWSTLWKQASESMMIQVKFAPVVAKATVAAYQAQSLATKAQASQSREDGIISLVAFGGAMAMGMSGMKVPGMEDDEELDDTDTQLNRVTEDNADPLNTNLNEANQNVENAEGAATQEQLRAQTEVQNRADTLRGEDETTWKGRAKKKLGSPQERVQQGAKLLKKYLGKGFALAQGTGMLAQASNGAFVDSHYQAEVALQKSYEGQAQALSQEANQYSQFYGQNFSRSDQLRQGNQQNIDYAMSILKSAADTITQTVTSMFRG